MPHVRLLGVGRSNMTGMLGQHEFKDGVSVKDLPFKAAARLRCILECEAVSGEELHPVNIQAGQRGQAPAEAPIASQPQPESETVIVVDPTEGTISAVMTPAKFSQAFRALNAATPEEPATSQVFTRAQLEEMADKGGIASLRAISDTLGIKANSIGALIDKILDVQAKG